MNLRTGVIGTGAWARAAHLPALVTMPGVDLVAIAGIDAAERAQAADEFGVSHQFGTGTEMLRALPLDLVHIVTPDDQHVPDAQLAIELGIPVLCEKPLAVSVGEAEELVANATARAIPTKMGFTMRYAPAVAHLRDLVHAGAFGELRQIQAFQQNGQFLDPEKPVHWKMDPVRTGGGAIVEYGIHTLDLMRWIMGEVVRVSALSVNQVDSRPDGSGNRVPVTVDDSTSWLFAFESGATGLAHAGWSTVGRGPGLELRVYGSSGAAICRLSDDLPGGETLLLANGTEQRFEPVEIPASYSAGIPQEWHWWRRFNHALVRSFVEELHGRGEPAATFADGLAAQRLLAAVQIAAAESRWVDLDQA